MGSQSENFSNVVDRHYNILQTLKPNTYKWAHKTKIFPMLWIGISTFWNFEAKCTQMGSQNENFSNVVDRQCIDVDPQH